MKILGVAFITTSFLMTGLVACGDSSGSGGSGANGNGGSGASSNGGSNEGGTPATGGGGESSTGGSPATGGGGSGGGCDGVVLTVKNYLSWCSVTVADEAPSTAADIEVCVPANSTVDLSATALAGFILGEGPWHDTNSPGAPTGDPPHSDTTVDVTTGADCVWVCCPFPDGSGCPTADQCP